MNIGEKIRNLRIQNGLTQDELAERAELSKGFISQVERDLTSISIATLVDVLACLGTNLRDFFSDMEDDKIVFGEDDYFSSEDEEAGTNITWIVPNCQKNDMEPIIVKLQPGATSRHDDAHAGEEFGYVMSGTITLYLGSRKFKAKKGECFYFKASGEHYLKNTGRSVATVLWLSTPPSF